MSAVAIGSARLLAGARPGRPVDLDRHRAVHGPRRRRSLDALVAEVDAVRLLGRGGAAFPVAIKLRGLTPGPRVQVVVNGSESEPASHKDRTLMTQVPHLVLDGAAIVADALGAPLVTVAVHDRAAYDALLAAHAERRHREPGGPELHITRQAGTFVSGEVRAVLRALDGGPAVPPARRTLPTVSGLGGAPTFASNVETFAQIAVLTSIGAAAYAEVGDPAEPGTTLLTLLGDVPTAGVVEVPTGLPLRALLPGPDAPVLLGGYHGRWVRDLDELTVSRTALRGRGLSLGAGVVARLPHDACALAEVAAVAAWLAAQSAGQCGPCLYGTSVVAGDVAALVAGRATPDVATRLAGLAGRGACTHPDGMVGFVASALDVLAEEVAAHRAHGSCGRPQRRVLPLTGGADAG